MKSWNIKLVGGVIAALFLLTVTLVVAAPTPLWTLLMGESIHAGADPLSATEMVQAQQLALQNAALSTQISSAERREVLLVERHQEPKAIRRQGAWPRRADYYVGSSGLSVQLLGGD